MKGPFFIRKGKQTGGGILNELVDIKVAHIDEQGIIHVIGIDTPEREVYWLLRVGARLKGDRNQIPLIRIITDLNMWWPVAPRGNSQTRFNAYFDIYESDHAWVLLQMDCRDKKFIKDEICRKLNL